MIKRCICHLNHYFNYSVRCNKTTVAGSDLFNEGKVKSFFQRSKDWNETELNATTTIYIHRPTNQTINERDFQWDIVRFCCVVSTKFALYQILLYSIRALVAYF